MAFPKTDKVLLGRPPLRQVIAQVRYPVLPRFDEPGFVAGFIEQVTPSFPKLNKEVQQVFRISNTEEMKIPPTETLWRLTARDGGSSAVLGQNAVTLEITQHRSIEELTAQFRRVLSAAIQCLGIAERSRLGLRYINEIRYEGADTFADWASLLSPEFLGFVASDVIDGSVEKMSQEIRIRRSDGVLAFRHGFVSRSIDGADAPSLELGAAGSAYLLDLDYYDDSDTTLNEDQVIEQLTNYSAHMYDLFRWTLGDELFKFLEESNDDAD